MGEHNLDIDVLIRTVSSTMEPITLEEVVDRASRLEDELEPLTIDSRPLSSAGQMAVLEGRSARRNGARYTQRRRSRRALATTATVALVAGLVSLFLYVERQRHDDRIASTGTSIEAVDRSSTTTSDAFEDFTTDTTLDVPLGPPEVVVLDSGLDILALTMLDNGRLAAGGVGDTIQLWDPENPEIGPTSVRLDDNFGVGEQTRSVSSLAQLPTGGLAVASSYPDSIVIEQVVAESGIGLLGGQYSGNVAPQSRMTLLRDGSVAFGGTGGIVSIGPAGDAVVQYNTGHSGTVLAVVELPDGRLVSGGSEGTIRIWDRVTGTETAESPVGPDRSDAVTALTVLPDGRLASASADGTIRVWNLNDPSDEPDILDQHTDTITTLTVLPDGRLASGSTDGTIRIWLVDAESDPVSIAESTDVSGAGPADPRPQDIPVLSTDRAPVVVECEAGPPEFPPNDGESDLEPKEFATPESALDDVLASIPGGVDWKQDLLRLDTPDGSINYAAPADDALPVDSRRIDEALLLVVVRPSGSGGYTATSWEMVGC